MLRRSLKTRPPEARPDRSRRGMPCCLMHWAPRAGRRQTARQSPGWPGWRLRRPGAPWAPLAGLAPSRRSKQPGTRQCGGGVRRDFSSGPPGPFGTRSSGKPMTPALQIGPASRTPWARPAQPTWEIAAATGPVEAGRWPGCNVLVIPARASSEPCGCSWWRIQKVLADRIAETCAMPGMAVDVAYDGAATCEIHGFHQLRRPSFSTATCHGCTATRSARQPWWRIQRPGPGS